jgi:hypothetical protein
MLKIAPRLSNEVAPVDCPEPSSLLAVEHFPRLRAAAELGRSGRLGFTESQRNPAHARLATENVRLNLRWS